MIGGRPAAIAALVALALLACAVGPDYRRPEMPAPPTFREQDPGQTESLADLPWWEVFRDAELAALIREALENSYDLRTAAARVEQSLYLAAVDRAPLAPQVGYRVSSARGQNSFLGNPFPDPTHATSDQFLTAFTLSWEIDLWGRIRRTAEAARASLLADEAARRGVVLSLVTGVAQAYLELRELDLELEIVRRTVTSFHETYELFERQFQGGVASRLDPLSAAAALSQAEASVPDVERQIAAKQYQLCVLLGRAPGEIARGADLDAQWNPPEVPAGLPAELLRRRPDLLQAEQQLVAANAQVGVAFAAFFPDLTLTGLFGSVSIELNDLLGSPSRAWAVAGDVVGPLFTAGQVTYGWKAALAARDQRRFAYRQSLLVALQEVATSLTDREKLGAVRAAREEQVSSLRGALDTARVRYLGGLATYLNVLTAQQQLFPAELDLARAKRDQLLAVVALYRALGGGWRSAPTPPEIPSPIAP